MAQPDLFAAPGEAAALMRRSDWARTPVGPVEQWPQVLRSAVRIVLSSRYPMLLLWGEAYTQLYNDAYSALIGDQHPAAMGGDVRVTLAEGWPVLGPIIEEAVRTGVASWVPALQLLLERAGYREEAYFSVSHAPVLDDDGVTQGVLTVCSEVTDQVVGDRRLRLLRELSVASGQTLAVDEAVAAVTGVLAQAPLDVPLAAVYLLQGGTLRRVATVGRDAGGEPVALPAELPVTAEGGWGVAGEAATTGRSVAGPLPAGLAVPGGPFDDPVRTLYAAPLPAGEDEPALGVLLLGVSPSRALDETHRSFLDLLVQQVAVALRNARAHEDERRRAEALAELDRVKTAFFTNVSHEFRTPLTLLLGPLGDALAEEPAGTPQAERLAIAQRGAERLLVLVNDLLSFSRLEAGAEPAVAERGDLARDTEDAASAFRAAVERAGLELAVDCPPLPEPVAYDRGGWEKIVSNLLSNALKHTFVGRIDVRLRSGADGVVLEVADTGIGIAPEEQERLFERFSRVAGARSRTHEGTGIGLALVRELARLQGGEASVESAPGVGSTFRVALPWSALRRPAGTGTGTGVAARGSAAASAATAAQWGPRPLPDAPAAPAAGEEPVRVLVADDNADMRAYVVRVLQTQGWAVTAVADGQEALEAVHREPPDLLLTDVMMPRLDGFELLRALRAAPETRTLPVVVLSARAGAEAGVEGLDLGADDYVAKPFVAEDLLARLRATLALARARSRSRRQKAVLADTVALISSGRALDEAVRLLTAQARALLDGERAMTTLVDRAGTGELVFTAPEEAGAGEQSAGEPVQVEVRTAAGLLGSLAVWPQAGQPADPEAVALLDGVAAALGVLAERSWAPDREHDVGLVLQRSLLPDRLPEVDGLELAARYLPAAGELQVGGDWYDVLPLPGGRVLVSVGDVVGHGLSAATAMGQLRSAVRAYVLQGASPAAVVDQLQALAELLSPVGFATLFVAYLDVAEGALAWASAGHPPPLLLTGDGGARWLDGEVGPPVGAAFGALAVPHLDRLADGDTLLLYTDGLVEDREGQLDLGLPRLLAAARAAAGASPAALVDAVVDAAETGRRDDVAVLAVHRPLPVAPVAGPSALRPVEAAFSYAAEHRSAGRLRRDARAVLGEAGLPEDLVDDVLLAVSEAFSNAVEHAQAPSRPQVDVRVSVTARALTLTVQDYGSWRERRPALDRGRGSVLMSVVGQVRVEPSAVGTAVTIERRLG